MEKNEDTNEERRPDEGQLPKESKEEEAKSKEDKKDDKDKEDDEPRKDEQDGPKEDTEDDMLSKLREYFARTLGFGLEKEKPENVEKVLEEVSFNGIVNYIKSGKCTNIIAMVGAGISTSAGIPDFRSPGSGLYANLAKYNLPNPQCIFEINFFKENPQPFYHLAKELFPGKFKPTPCHYFLKLLHDKSLLRRLYSQNIDSLERVAGIPDDKIVEAHGSFYKSHCISAVCRKEYSLEWMKDKILGGIVPTCEKCNTVIKPDIVFFGERLPDRFYSLVDEDFPKSDLLLIIGTSLTVQPFAGLIDQVKASTPRLLINKIKCGQSGGCGPFFGSDSGLEFDSKNNYRDVAWLGLCDDGCFALAKALGWEKELENLIEGK